MNKNKDVEKSDNIIYCYSFHSTTKTSNEIVEKCYTKKFTYARR